MDIKTLTEKVQKAAALLSEPEPGVSTWHEAVREQMNDLAAAWLGSPAEYDRSIVPMGGILIDVQQFRECCLENSFIDYDGHGYPVKNGKAACFRIIPSRVALIPIDATHILWFNR